MIVQNSADQRDHWLRFLCCYARWRKQFVLYPV